MARRCRATGELIWDIGDQLQLTGGARYIWENKDSEFTQPYVNPAFSALFIQDRVLASDKSYDDVVAELTMRYQPTDKSHLLRGLQAGLEVRRVRQRQHRQHAELRPDRRHNLRTGRSGRCRGRASRAFFLDGALSLDFDIYHYQFKNLQLNFFNATTFAYRTFETPVLRRPPAARLQVNWATQVEGLTLSAAIAYNDASYKEFLAPCYGGQSFSEGCNIGTGALKDQDLSGEPRGLAPKWRGNLGFKLPAARWAPDWKCPVGGNPEVLRQLHAERVHHQRRAGQLRAARCVRAPRLRRRPFGPLP